MKFLGPEALRPLLAAIEARFAKKTELTRKLDADGQAADSAKFGGKTPAEFITGLPVGGELYVTTGTATALTVNNVPGWTDTDGRIIRVRPHIAVGANATITVRSGTTGGTARQIRASDDTQIQASVIAANTVMTLVYYNTRFFLQGVRLFIRVNYNNFMPPNATMERDVLTALSAARSSLAAATNGDGDVLFGGGDTASQSLNVVDRYYCAGTIPVTTGSIYSISGGGEQTATAAAVTVPVPFTGYIRHKFRVST